MRRLQQIVLSSVFSKVFLALLAGMYVAYLVGFGQVVSLALPFSSPSVSVHVMSESASDVLNYWTTARMSTAINDDVLQANTGVQASSDSSQGQAAKQQGQAPRNGNAEYPLSTVGKLFLTSATGQNMVCSGTAVVSSNDSVVDTAGHCLYWNGGWVRNVLFCPLYDSGK